MTSRYTTTINATGPDANVYAVAAICRLYMRHIGHKPDEVEALTERVMQAQSREDALAVIREWFPVVTDASPAAVPQFPHRHNGIPDKPDPTKIRSDRP